MTGAVFLDLDGTLVDAAEPITTSITLTLEQLGLNVPENAALRRYIGPPLIETFGVLGAPDPHLATEVYRSHYVGERMLDASLYEGAEATLAELKDSGYRLYLMTAKPHVYACRITAHLGLSHYFTAEYGPELDGRFNDKSELLKHALQETGEPATRAVMVGDRGSDLRAGRLAGMPVIAALWGFGAAGELSDADLSLHDLCDLPEAVARLIGKENHDQ